MSVISVIVAVYNVEKYLRQCVDSIIGQTYRDLEIILVDDGSTDSSGGICDEYAAKDERIQVVHQDDLGPASARNVGLRRASGDWIVFVDSDDWLDLDYCEEMLAEIGDRKPDVLMAGGYISENEQPTVKRMIGEPFYMTDPAELRSLAIRILARKQPVKGLVSRVPMCYVWDKIYNRKFLCDNGIDFSEDAHMTGDDIVFNWRVFSRAHEVMGSTRISYHYRIIGTSGTRRYIPDRFDDAMNMLRAIIRDISQEEIAERFPEEIISVVTLQTVGATLRNDVLHPDNPKSRSERKKEYERIRNTPEVQKVVRSKDNRYLMAHHIILKHLLRIPWFWPVELCWGVYARHKKKTL